MEDVMLYQINIRFFAIISIMLITILQIHAQTRQDIQKKNPEVRIKNSEFFTISSSYTNDEYEIYVSLPLGYEKSDTTYPAVYCLDGDVGFGMTTDICRLLQIRNELPELVIVCIAYGAYPGQKGNNRERDYTPTTVPNKEYSGGAGNFLDFVRSDLIPKIESNYKVNPSKRTIIGVSLGGLFGLYVVFQKHDIFQNYIICSPSIWWDNKTLLQLEKSYSESRSELPIHLFLSVGELENKDNMIIPWQELIKAIKSRNYSGLSMKSVMIDGETHLSAQPDAIVKGLKFVFSND
jgi:predicted alpha/beta superfamily hydrolase